MKTKNLGLQALRHINWNYQRRKTKSETKMITSNIESNKKNK